MTIRFLTGDCRTLMATLPDQSVHMCVTSPPYFNLRDYGMADQIGIEQTPVEFVEQLVAVFRELRRVLRDDGTLWLNLADSYANDTKWGGSTSGKHAQAVHGNRGIGRSRTSTGLPSKSLIGIPWRVAFALQDDGWILRQDIIWSKPNPMPESVTDRCTKAHEYVFLLSKSPTYWCDMKAIAEPSLKGSNGLTFTTGKTLLHQLGRTSSAERVDSNTRNKRSVWTIAKQSFSDAHFATMAPELAETCIKAGCPEGGTVLDPFSGAGTTGLVADRLQRSAVLIELNPAYVEIARRRIAGDAPMFSDVVVAA